MSSGESSKASGTAPSTDLEIPMYQKEATKDVSESPTDDLTQPRDEVQAIRKLSKKDTNRITATKLLVTLFMVATGVAVSLTTYYFLVAQENRNFEDAYSRFSQTVRDAALEENLKLREGARELAQVMSGTGEASGVQWPFYDYEKIYDFLQLQAKSKKMEGAAFFTRVLHDDRAGFIDFVATNLTSWINSAHMKEYGHLDYVDKQGQFSNEIIGFGPNGPEPAPEKDEYWVAGFGYPPYTSSFVFGLDTETFNPMYSALYDSLVAMKNETLISNVNPVVEISEVGRKRHAQFHSDYERSEAKFPHSFMYHPVHEVLGDPESQVVATILIQFAWDASLRFLLPDDLHGLTVVLSNTCGQVYSYTLSGEDAFYFGDGDLHEPEFEQHKVTVNFDFHENPDFEKYEGHCVYELAIYPSQEFKDLYMSSTPTIFVAVTGFTFFVMVCTFLLYDLLVRQRNDKLVNRAAKSNEIVSSMFPDVLQEKIFKQSTTPQRKSRANSSTINHLHEEGGLHDILMDNEAPLAEIYPDTTVLFADVVGFTAWASVREPSQVFELLENVFRNFDEIARKRRVFKVETVGDCYVAVTGFPKKQHDHAERMCRFARECLSIFSVLASSLELKLGPDTSDLGIRVGMNSGQVTAGVLRGDRARFQLFGDTVNTTARVEAASEPGRILVSQSTAEYLVKAGKRDWLSVKVNEIVAKGKGSIKTYWLTNTVRRNRGSDNGSVTSAYQRITMNLPTAHLKTRTKRLVEWNVLSLVGILKRVVARREMERRTKRGSFMKRKLPPKVVFSDNFLEEVKEIIQLPEYRAPTMDQSLETTVGISKEAEDQLRDYVTTIARMYRDCPFHNFEHASHVAMSVIKLLSRIVAPVDLDEDTKDMDSAMHDNTYGITSDPLTQFACAFSALIHDVDHTGVPNTTLMDENPEMAERFHCRSVAEQNSLDLAWNLLQDDRFKDMRELIFTTADEQKRFRELVVNGVMATDIVDRKLKELRNGRWDKAFSKAADIDEMTTTRAKEMRDDTNRKATIVIEHLIQASDVSHTMQHWHVYRKWNERLFEEMYLAYKQGRSTANPADNWVKGEVGFFDFYIIPLAKKLKDCGVFGLSSDEYLNYAVENRRRWIEQGESVVAEMLEKLSESDTS